MCEKCAESTRRDFLKIAGAAVILAVVAFFIVFW